MVMTLVASPYVGVIIPNETEQLEAVFGAGIDIGTVEVTEGVDAGIVREVNGVGEVGIRSETRVLEHTTVEDKLEHKSVGAEPAVGTGMGL